MDIHKGDGIITHAGNRGIATSEPFKATSHFDYDVVRVKFDEIEMPVQVASIAEVWHGGVRVDNVEHVEQLELLL